MSEEFISAILAAASRGSDIFAKVVCDIHQVRPPDLHIIDGYHCY